MPKGKFEGKVVAIGGINGTGPIVSNLVNWLASELKYRVELVHSEDSGRLGSMGAKQVPGLPFGISRELDFFYELTARAINCKKFIIPALQAGKTVLCKNWTIESRVNIALNFPGSKQRLFDMEEMSRGFDLESLVVPDLSIMLNVDPVSCFARLKDDAPCRPAGYYLQMQELYLEELSKVNGLVIETDEHQLFYAKVKAAIEAL